MPIETPAMYNAPNGTPSDVDALNGSMQFNTFLYYKKAIIDAKKEQYFTPLADSIAMPKHMGKTIKVYQYVPLLDDRNLNDQGIDAAGAVINNNTWRIEIPFEKKITTYTVEANATAAAAAINAVEAGVAVKTGSSAPWTVTLSKTTLANSATLAQKDAILAAYSTAIVRRNSGNLYGSSKDIGVIQGKLPFVGEGGGRVNRVGFARLAREGSITKFGMFTEFTDESLTFDTDADLFSHYSRELVNGAAQISEACLQMDLLAGAGVIVYAGDAVSKATISAEGAVPDVVDYGDFVRLSITLDENRTPKQTKVITGSLMTDTKTISGGRVMYIGTELQQLVQEMDDSRGDAAFTPVRQYAAATTLLNGEIGTIDQFRIVVVPEMLHWGGAGAVVGTNPGYRETNGRYDVYPMLVIGNEAFTTIGFQTDGETVKFDINTKMPGKAVADRSDPYGEVGFMAMKWWYGIIIMRPERIAVIMTVAPF